MSTEFDYSSEYDFEKSKSAQVEKVGFSKVTEGEEDSN